jgi:splicing factor 3A subunit 1
MRAPFVHLLHVCVCVRACAGELVAISEMEEHMRVSLIDPRWKEQREAMISRIK